LHSGKLHRQFHGQLEPDSTEAKPQVRAAGRTAAVRLLAGLESESQGGTGRASSVSDWPRRTISPTVVKAIRELKKDEEIVMVPADKGRATVILDKSEYVVKAQELLNDSQSYNFNDQMETFENTVYRLDFLTWQWQTISLGSGQLTQPPREVPQPSPRDFASLMVCRDWLLLFGGRRYASLPNDTEGASRSPADEVLEPVDHSMWYFCHRELIDHLAASYDLARAAWEEATENWER
uniref:OCRE domain-containing protein n=1 Tax=Schistocephalus solidus TaxID=70667 RepID=A0A183SAC5_SCHSO